MTTKNCELPYKGNHGGFILTLSFTPTFTVPHFPS